MRDMRTTVAAWLVVATVSVMSAQDTSRPAFDVASVKPNPTGAPGSSGRTGKGSVTFTNMNLRSLIANAYDVRGSRIVGGPASIDSERFDINARAAPDEAPGAAGAHLAAAAQNR